MPTPEKNTALHPGICEVHQYALNDTQTRMVFYCSICDADICEECNTNIPLRTKAAAKRAAQTTKNAIHNFFR